jgi:DNA polymerase III gamma/tau subunit
MIIKPFYSKFLVGFLSLTMIFTPGMVGVLLAQDASQTPTAASDDEIQTIQELAKAGYLGDQKKYYLSSQTLTEDDITNAIVQANGYVMAADLKQIQAGNSSYQVSDLQSLLDLVKDKSADIRAKKVSAWKLENRLGKMIALLSAPPSEQNTPEAVSTVTPVVPTPTSTAIPATPTPTPIPGPSRQEFNDLKESFKSLNDKLFSLQNDVDKKSDAIQDLQKNNTDIQSTNADIQEQLKLVKKLLDRVQDDLTKSEERVGDVEKKVETKMVTDTEMQQEITVMHKDVRDDTEDISVLKEEVAKLDKTDVESHNPIDDFLTSKWLPGGALIVGLAALTVSLVRK